MSLRLLLRGLREDLSRLWHSEYEKWTREDRLAFNFATLVALLFGCLFLPYERLGLSTIQYLIIQRASMWGFVGLLLGAGLNHWIRERRSQEAEV
jgi:hypothetical protein